MSKIKLFSIILLFILLAVILIFYNWHFKKRVNVEAVDSTNEITTALQWDLGTKENISSNSGTMTILDPTGGEVDLLSLYNNENTSITTSIDNENRSNVVDSDEGTYWLSTLNNNGDSNWWKVDLGSQRQLTSYRALTAGTAPPVGYSMNISCSLDDVTYSAIESGSPNINYDPPDGIAWDEKSFSPSPDCRYVMFEFTQYFDDELTETYTQYIYEFELYGQGNSATHTTAATQIDGQEGSADKDLVEWTSFTPTQTTPLNTSISYEFRTSADGSDWSAWSASQTYSGSPLDLTGLTANRYLQVRSTLSTTDALSTPQIDDYTINFHNNEAPSQPTAQTAVISR